MGARAHGDFTPPLEISFQDGEHHESSPLPSSIENLQIEVKNLRGRLSRRNAVLDAIRKAYHHDVVVVKECLTSQGLDKECLTQIPSIDIRPALKLFAPADCELLVKPCDFCGGCLEIVHTESSKLKRLNDAFIELQNVEQDLRMKMCQVELEAGKDRDQLAECKARSAHDREILMKQVDALNNRISGNESIVRQAQNMHQTIDSLKADIEGHQTTVSELGAVRGKLTDAENAVASSNLEIQKLTNQLELSTNREQDFREQQEVLSMEISTICEKNSLLKNTNASLKNDVEEGKKHQTRTINALDQSRQHEASLGMKLSQMEKEQQDTIRRAELRYENVVASVKDLQDEVQEKDNLATFYEQELRNAIKKHRSVELSLETQRESGRATMREHVLQMASSIASFFNACVAQEMILNGGGGETIVSNASNNGKVAILDGWDGTSSELQSTDWWMDLIKEANDRTEISRYIKERHQSGLEAIGSLLDRVRKDSERLDEVRHARDELESKLKISRVESAEEDRRHQEISRRYEAVKAEVDEVRLELSTVQEESIREEEKKEELSQQCEAANSKVTELELELSTVHEQLSREQEKQSQVLADLHNRDENIRMMKSEMQEVCDEVHVLHNDIERKECEYYELEKAFSETSRGYDEIVEKENMRLLTNKDVGTQMSSCIHEVGIQADLVSTSEIVRQRMDPVCPRDPFPKRTVDTTNQFGGLTHSVTAGGPDAEFNMATLQMMTFPPKSKR